MANCSALQIIWADPQSAKPLDAARVLSVSLNEGISELYQAKVVLLCQRALGADELASLPGQKLRLEIEQLDSDGLVLTRYLQAVVKSAAFRAALYQGRQGESSRPVLRYDLELCSPLEDMHTHSAVRSFAGLTLPQVLRTLISPYTQRAVFDRELLNESGFDNLQYYQQQNQSDFEFMAALLLRSGINFNFVHGKEGFEPELIFSRGLRFDKGGHVYAAGQAIGGAPLKAGLEASQGGIYLENFCWKAKADRSAGQQAQLKTRLLSVSASRLSGRLPQQLEERRLLQNLKDRSRSLQLKIKAQSSDLALQPGCVVQVQLQQGSAAPNESAELTVKRAQLQAAADYPLDLALPPGMLPRRELKVKLKFLKPPQGAARCGCLLPGSMLNHKSGTAGIRAQAGLPEIADRLQLCEGTVCCEDGSLEQQGKSRIGSICLPPGDDTADPAHFYVRLAGAKAPVIAERTALQGGGRADLSAFPRVGDRVLLMCSSERSYLCGYLKSEPGSLEAGQYAHTAFDRRLRDRTLNALTLARRDEEGRSLTVNLENFATLGDYIVNKIMTGQMDLLARRACFVQNDSKIWGVYQSKYQPRCSELAASCRRAQAECEQAAASYEQLLASADSAEGTDGTDGGSGSEELDEFLAELRAQIEEAKERWNGKKSELEEFLTELYALAGELEDFLSLDGSYANTTMSLTAEDGNIELSAQQGQLNSSAQSVKTTAAESVLINADTITLSANKKINLAVAGQAIAMSPTGISLVSQKWTQIAGYTDAMVFIDSLSGVSVKGMQVALAGGLSAAVCDGMGGALLLSNGTASLAGNQVSLAVSDRLDAIMNLSTFGAQLVNECVSFLGNIQEVSGTEDGQDLTTAGKCINYLIPDLKNITKYAMQVKQQVKGYQQQNTTLLKLITSILNTLSTLTDTTAHVLMVFFAEENEKQLGREDINFTTSDLLKLLTLSMKLTITVLTMVEVLPKLKRDKKNLISINGEGTTFTSQGLKMQLQSSVFAYDPTAGQISKKEKAAQAADAQQADGPDGDAGVRREHSSADDNAVDVSQSQSSADDGSSDSLSESSAHRHQSDGTDSAVDTELEGSLQHSESEGARSEHGPGTEHEGDDGLFSSDDDDYWDSLYDSADGQEEHRHESERSEEHESGRSAEHDNDHPGSEGSSREGGEGSEPAGAEPADAAVPDPVVQPAQPEEVH